MTATELPRGIRIKNGSYMVDVSYKGQRATACGLPDLKTAKLKQRELKSQLMLGRAPTTGKSPKGDNSWTLKEAIEVTRRVRWEGRKAVETMDFNSEALKSFFGDDARLDSLDANAVDRYVDYLKNIKGNSDATINRKLSCLRVIMKTAQARGGCTSVTKMEKRPEYEGRTRFLTEQEEATLLATLRHWGRDAEADFVTVLIDTGMRYGEATRITRQDVMLKKGERGSIVVWISKGDKPRSIPMTARVKEIVERRMAETKEGDARLFPYRKNWLKRIWEKVKAAMGLQDDVQLVVHSLRHTCASRLVQRGVPIRVVQVWLGHKNVTTTERYALLAPTSLLDAAAVLE